eukprot:CAMPEP_0179270860 /NCGR_PEP_ID=MMETSP0797-20121207/31680_1 /TAXON_ID=47934 /ORGANISM="Dinophysis acuminata, Strain DAEP01" /LENGTH=452 /DNA_ID=CAMNT_0020979199 /DNA_START=56 /DNA_END=1414 /DNA_ORIENTATION=-
MASSSVSARSRDVPGDVDMPHKFSDICCDSPLSQASTAASTPMLSSVPQRSSLLGSLSSDFFRLESSQVAEEGFEDDDEDAEDVSTGDGTGAGTIGEDESDDGAEDGEAASASPEPPTLKSELAQWAEKAASASPAPPTLKSELAQWAEKVVSTHPVPPTLKSELAQWAEKAVSTNVVPPALKSVLAQWAEKEVQVEMDVKTDDSDDCDDAESDEVLTDDESVCTEVVVDDPAHVVSVGIPQLQSELGRWAQKVVRAEQWLELQNKRRARDGSLAAVEADSDGPALAPGGLAVDLASGSALFFSHDKALASSQLDKERAKEELKLARAVKLAHAACEAEARIEAGEVCSIDEAGVLRGDMSAPAKPRAVAMRLKEIHLRRQRQRKGSAPAQPEAATLCADANGRVSFHLHLDDPVMKRLRRAKLTRPLAGGVAEVLAIDGEGVVRGSPADLD